MKYILLLLLSFNASADSLIVGGLSYHFDRDYGYNESHVCLGYARDDFTLMACDRNSYGNTSVYATYKPFKHIIIGLASGYKNTDKAIPMIGSLALFGGLIFEFDFGKVHAPVVITNSGLISWVEINL